VRPAPTIIYCDSMTRVLLAHSYFLRLDPKQHAKMRPYPPLNTLHAATVLRSNGVDVAVFDAMLAADETEFAASLLEHQPDVVVLYEDNFNFLSKMCLTRMREAALTMVAMARAAGCRVAACGADVTDHPEIYLAAGVEACLLGEGEHTMREVVDRWLGDNDDERDISEIEGLATVVDGKLVNTGRRSIERHPDVFGAPARDLVDIEAYRAAWTEAHGRFSLNLVSTRGCPYHCNWCAKPIWGQRYSMRSAVEVAAEFIAVHREHRPDHVWFADDIFGLRSDWLAEFASHVTDADVQLPFTVQSRCDLMNEQAVEALSRAGCDEVWLGAESGSQRVLDAMDKGITVEQIRTARSRLADHGVRACFFIQFGYPGETWTDIEQTISLVAELLPDDIGVSVSYPLPGTRFHEMVRLDLDDNANWESSGDLAMMFEGTYPTAIYRELHLSLHDDLDLRRREAGLSRCRHPLIDDVPVAQQRGRVEQRWAALRAREERERNPNPTRLRIPLVTVPV
jgi:anaerobic magnesium-protoporphyrin IX monomethyl ester cyclase